MFLDTNRVPQAFAMQPIGIYERGCVFVCVRGFRKGGGCVVMVLVARQPVEKTREHNDSLHVLFIDLKKGYDSIPRGVCGEPLASVMSLLSY